MKITIIELLTPKYPSEKELKNFLKKNPSLIEEGATYLEDEFNLGHGRIDMVFVKNDKIIFVELKVQRYYSKNILELHKKQIIKYYRSILGLAKLFGSNERSFKFTI